MKEKMSRWGVGPVFGSLSIGYGVAVLAISCYFYPAFQIDFMPYWSVFIPGFFLIVGGAVFLILSAKTVMRAYDADELVLKGTFRCCRHPIYASWTVFIVPGIALLANSWIGLTIPIFMYLILRKLVLKEEKYLESVFGIEYLNYKRRMPCIIPYGLFKQKI